MNLIVISGRLREDIEVKEHKEGRKSCQFKLAVLDPYAKTEVIDWIKCRAWGSTAENLAKGNKKGDQILVRGVLKVTSYMQEEVRKENIFVNVESWEYGQRAKGNVEQQELNLDQQ